jgi:ankyrin repeat protein
MAWRARFQNGWTALIEAAIQGKVKEVALLLRAGANTEAQTNVSVLHPNFLFDSLVWASVFDSPVAAPFRGGANTEGHTNVIVSK